VVGHHVIESLGFRTDLMLRALAGSQIVDHGDHLVVRTDQNPSYYWGNFVLAADDLDNAERWVGAFQQSFSDATHVAIGLDTTRADVRLDGYRTAGLTPDVSTVLVAAELLEPRRPPPEAEFRPLRTDADWAQAMTPNAEGRLEPEEQGFQDRKLAEWRRLAEAGHGAWFGAFVDGALRAGLGLFSDGSGVARYQSVDTHLDYRGRGLASWLIYEAGGYGRHELAADQLVIVADHEYVAIEIYRALGFVDAEAQVQLQFPA
jgi:GNAT superfamily N-acetyltransferase